VRNKSQTNSGLTHELVSLFHDNHGLIVVSQPHGSMSARGAAPHDDDVASDRVIAAGWPGYDPANEKRGHETYTRTNLIAMHIVQEKSGFESGRALEVTRCLWLHALTEGKDISYIGVGDYKTFILKSGSDNYSASPPLPPLFPGRKGHKHPLH